MGRDKGFMTRVREADSKSNNLASYCSNMAPITVKIGIQMWITVLAAAVIAIGVLGLNDCPVNDLIPIYLIAVGGVSLVWLFIEVLCERCGYDTVKAWFRITKGVVAFGLFLVGNVWVYGVWEEVDTQADNSTFELKANPDYCNPWVFWTAFAQISLGYGIVLLLVCSLLIWGLLTCCVRLCCSGEPGETTPLKTATAGSSAA